jgi:hypothetical protein
VPGLGRQYVQAILRAAAERERFASYAAAPFWPQDVVYSWLHNWATMFEPLNISVSDSAATHELAAVHVGSGTAMMGVDNTMPVMLVAPEMHPHNQQHG